MEGRSEPHFLEDEIIPLDNCNYLKIVSKEKSFCYPGNCSRKWLSISLSLCLRLGLSL